jgi:hypothetical protein
MSKENEEIILKIKRSELLMLRSAMRIFIAGLSEDLEFNTRESKLDEIVKAEELSKKLGAAHGKS